MTRTSTGFVLFEREGGWSTALMEALLSLLSFEEVRESGGVFGGVFGEGAVLSVGLSVAAAVLDNNNKLVTNERWRRTFGQRTPPWAISGLRMAARCDVALQVPQVPDVSEDLGRVGAYALPAYGARFHKALIIAGEHADIGPPEPVTLLVCSGTNEQSNVITYCNEAMAAGTGAQPGDSWHALVHPSDVESCRVIRASSHHGTSRTIDVRLRGCDGEYRWHLVQMLVAEASNRWFLVAADCHEGRAREAAHAELLERVRTARLSATHAHEMKDRVLAVVSHELRAPVMTMLLWERVLRAPETSAETRLQALDAIHQSATLQSRLVGDLLDLSRVSSGKLYIDIRPVNILDVVTEAAHAFGPTAEAKQIQLALTADEECGTIMGDPARLRQTIDNLLSNAIKFTEPGGHVNVSVTLKGRTVTIAVADDGRGIEPAALERIFEPFKQADDITARRQGGLGLGLAIAKQIAELHRGMLTAASEGAGRGTVMTLVFPTAGQRTSRPASPAAATTDALRGTRVLLVDDDARVRSALALLLGRTGAVVAGVESAAAARIRLESGCEEPHVIICDIAMPDESGYDFMRSLRMSGRKIPAIALTGFASQNDATRALAAGFDLHVAKPVDFERLIASLHQILIRTKHVTN